MELHTLAANVNTAKKVIIIFSALCKFFTGREVKAGLLTNQNDVNWLMTSRNKCNTLFLSKRGAS